MTALKQKLKWEGQLAARELSFQEIEVELASGTAERFSYYFSVSNAAWYAVELLLDGQDFKCKEVAGVVVRRVLDYFYGEWRLKQATPDGKKGIEEWKPFCLWYEQVMESLPFASALSDWNAVMRIAQYPPENKLPEAVKATGEVAWGWALIKYLRGEQRKEIESFLGKAESTKAKRPKLLCPVLRALIDGDAIQFEKALSAYLAYYRKQEFKRLVSKVVSFDGTILYHLGRKNGFEVSLPENVADHVIRFE